MVSQLFYFFYFGVSTLFFINQVSKLFDFFCVSTLFLLNQMFELLFFVQSVLPYRSKLIRICKNCVQITFLSYRNDEIA